MTVQYNQDVLTGGPVVFLRLLLRWKGGVLKLIYIDFIVFIIGYSLVSLVYRFALTDFQQRQFESVIIYVFNFQKLIPISFILGFYVQLVFNRFWQQFNIIPWTFTPSLAIVGTIHGEGRARVIRRTCTRYINAAFIIAASRLHVAAKKRFPTTQHLVHAGILTQREGDLIENTDPVAAQPFLPLVWTTAIVMRAEEDGFIHNPHALVNLISIINGFRGSLLKLFLMDKVCIPLVYTQVVTLAVYLYFVSSMIGRQFIVDSSPYSTEIRKDYYVPLFTILEFIVYMGWLRVAETLVNPMGEDDEDFDINLIINANWNYSMHLVDNKNHPTALVKDKFWNKSNVSLPHTEKSRKLQSTHTLGSIYNVNVAGADHLVNSASNVNRMSPQPHELPRTNETRRRRGISSDSLELAPTKGHQEAPGGGSKQDLHDLSPEPFALTQEEDRYQLPVVEEEDEEQEMKRSLSKSPSDSTSYSTGKEYSSDVDMTVAPHVTFVDETVQDRLTIPIRDASHPIQKNSHHDIPVLSVDPASSSSNSTPIP